MLSTQWLSAFAPVGQLNGTAWTACGAGVFFIKPPLLWYVTASHAVSGIGEENVSVLVTRSSGEGVLIVQIGNMLKQNSLKWIRDSTNDIAAAPFPQDPQIDIKAVSEKECIKLRDIIPSMPCFTIGCPYGISGFDSNRARPLVLDGIISGVDPQKSRIYTNAPTFPGNSGGPLIAVRSPFSPEGAVMVGQPTVLFAGIVLRTLLIPSPTPNSITPPLHLGEVTPSESVIALLNTDDANDVVRKLVPSYTTGDDKSS